MFIRLMMQVRLSEGWWGSHYLPYRTSKTTLPLESLHSVVQSDLHINTKPSSTFASGIAHFLVSLKKTESAVYLTLRYQQSVALTALQFTDLRVMPQNVRLASLSRLWGMIWFSICSGSSPPTTIHRNS